MIIIAGPTTGKTTLARLLLAERIPYTEGDEWLKDNHPDEYAGKGWRSNSPVSRENWLSVLSHWERTALRLDQTRIVLSSMWSVRMIEAAMLVAWRRPADVVALSAQRGDDPPMNAPLVRSWFDDITAGWARSSSAQRPAFTTLVKDQYLQGYLATCAWFLDATGLTADKLKNTNGSAS